MNKTRRIIVLSLLALLLAGCSDASAKISNAKEVLFTIGDTKVTKGDMYDRMLADDAGATVIQKALSAVVAKEVETTDAIKAEAQKTFDTNKKAVEDAKLDWLEQLKSAGFDSEEDYMNHCLDTAKQAHLVDQYIEENYDTLLAEHKPVKARMIFLSAGNDTEAAIQKMNKALDRIEAGEDFVLVAKETGSSEDRAKEKIYLRSDSTIDYNVLAFLEQTSSPKVSDVITAKNSNGYYIVQITNTNASQLKDEFVETLKADEDFTDEVYGYYMKKYGFRIYDITVYNQIKENFPAYLVQK